jgi:hypothetical protein
MGDNVDVFMEFLSRLSNKFLSRIFEIFIICFCRHISKKLDEPTKIVSVGWKCTGAAEHRGT